MPPMRNPKFLLTFMTCALLPLLASADDLVGLIRSGDGAALAAIRGGADVNALQPDGSSPLLWAVYRVDHTLVQELLARGAKPNVRNMLGASPLNEAIALNDLPMVEMLLKAKADPNLSNDDEQTPLMIAARNGSLPIAQALVKAGARVNEREKLRGQSALMWAIGANSPAVVDFLIKHKAEVDNRAAENDWGNQITSEPRAQYRPTGGLTPLLYATRSGCLDCVKSLLKAGADINKPTPDGVTPLMNAIDNNNYAVANYLLDQDANPHLMDWWSRSALYLAADMRTRGGNGRGQANAANGLGTPGAPDPGQAADAATAGAPKGSAIQILQRLLEMGVDPNTQLDMHRPFRGRFTDDLITTGCTPLLRAAISTDREAVDLLLKHGALPDLPNVMGVTPLMAASGIGMFVGASGGWQGPMGVGDEQQTNAIAVIGLLLKAGADVNARITDTGSHTALIARPSSMTDRQGQTALFGAVGAGNGGDQTRSWTRVAKFLIDNGARLDVKDAAGKTILDALAGKAGGRDTPSTPEMVKLIKGAMGVT
ncbi:MAG: ankyrin repeat domain-containing protein [Steroidobacteraceae bacterium]